MMMMMMMEKRKFEHEPASDRNWANQSRRSPEHPIWKLLNIDFNMEMQRESDSKSDFQKHQTPNFIIVLTVRQQCWQHLGSRRISTSVEQLRPFDSKRVERLLTKMRHSSWMGYHRQQQRKPVKNAATSNRPWRTVSSANLQSNHHPLHCSKK